MTVGVKKQDSIKKNYGMITMETVIVEWSILPALFSLAIYYTSNTTLINWSRAEFQNLIVLFQNEIQLTYVCCVLMDKGQYKILNSATFGMRISWPKNYVSMFSKDIYVCFKTSSIDIFT